MRSPRPPVLVPDTAPTRRLGSIDAYRGLVMFLMMAEVLRFCAGGPRPCRGTAIWEFLCHHQSHVEWIGCSLHDMIQPSFSFLVGVALPFSLASRLARGQSTGLMTAHAVWRSLVLVFLGVFLRSIGRRQTNFTFEDTLSQIGLGYTFLFLLGFRPVRVQWIAFVAASWSATGGCSRPIRLPGVRTSIVPRQSAFPQNWPHLMTGFPAHWNKNSNPAWAFDTWFLNLFPREQPFKYNGGGYATLSFIPTLATMILGLIAGGVLQARLAGRGTKLLWLVVAGGISLALGWGLGELGHLPGGQADLDAELGALLRRVLLPVPGGLLRVIDVPRLGLLGVPPAGHRHELDRRLLPRPPDRGFITDSLRTHLGRDVFKVLGPAYEPFLQGAAVLLVLWLILFWMYRRKIY